jgi:hypothetical protein
MAARWSVALGILSGAAVCALADEPPGCLLFHPGSDAVPTATCLSCHTLEGAGNHVVGIAYAPAAAADLRPAQEVVRRGVHLPGGQISCATCHDSNSPWKHHIALPPGTRAIKAVDLRDPATYEGPPVPAQPGDAVSVKPLCLSCHALD